MVPDYYIVYLLLFETVSGNMSNLFTRSALSKTVCCKMSIQSTFRAGNTRLWLSSRVFGINTNPLFRILFFLLWCTESTLLWDMVCAALSFCSLDRALVNASTEKLIFSLIRWARILSDLKPQMKRSRTMRSYESPNPHLAAAILIRDINIEMVSDDSCFICDSLYDSLMVEGVGARLLINCIFIVCLGRFFGPNHAPSRRVTSEARAKPGFQLVTI
jgi:hypothetical protein